MRKLNMARLTGNKIEVPLAEETEAPAFSAPPMRLQPGGREILATGRRADGLLAIKDSLVNARLVWIDQAEFRDGVPVREGVLADLPVSCRERTATRVHPGM
jgi:hypothetical protein